MLTTSGTTPCCLNASEAIEASDLKFVKSLARERERKREREKEKKREERECQREAGRNEKSLSVKVPILRQYFRALVKHTYKP